MELRNNKARASRLYIENLEKQLAELDITILNHTGSLMDLLSKQSELKEAHNSFFWH